MDKHSQWWLAGLSLCLLAGWLGHRWHQRAQTKQKAALANAEAQRVAAEAAARQRTERKSAARKAARAEAQTLAQAEAARAQAARVAAAELAAARSLAAKQLAADAAAQAETARRAAEQAADVEAARFAAQKAARTAAARLAAAEAARVRDALAAAQAAAAARVEAERQAAAIAAARPARARAAKAPDQTLVMIADDSKIVRVMTGRLLAQHQYRVAYASDGLDAAQQMRTNVPDVVITDVEMPGMDGFELVRHVRENPLTAHIPIIMITSADAKHRDDADRAGVNALLGKPYPEEDLIAQIQLAMKPRETRAGALA